MTNFIVPTRYTVGESYHAKIEKDRLEGNEENSGDCQTDGSCKMPFDQKKDLCSTICLFSQTLKIKS